MSQVLLMSQCCSSEMFEKDFRGEQTAPTAELITTFYVSLMPARSKCFYFYCKLRDLMTCGVIQALNSYIQISPIFRDSFIQQQ